MIRTIKQVCCTAKSLKKVSHFFLYVNIENERYKMLLESNSFFRFLFLSQMFLGANLIDLHSSKLRNIILKILIPGGLAEVLFGSTVPFCISCFLIFSLIAYVGAIEQIILFLLSVEYGGHFDDDDYFDDDCDAPVYEITGARSKGEHLFCKKIFNIQHSIFLL